MSTIEKTQAFFSRHLLIRYLVVGIGNTVVGYLLYAFFLFVGFEFRLANLFALAIGIGVSFKTQGVLVFKNPDNGLIFRFIACWIPVYFANIYAIEKIISFGFSEYTAGALAIPINVSMSYLMQKYLIFKKPAVEEKNHVDPN